MKIDCLPLIEFLIKFLFSPFILIPVLPTVGHVIVGENKLKIARNHLIIILLYSLCISIAVNNTSSWFDRVGIGLLALGLLFTHAIVAIVFFIVAVVRKNKSNKTQQGKFAEAEASYRKAIELDPNNAEAYTNLGRALAGQGEFVEAEKASRTAIELDPKNPILCENLAKILLDQNKIEEGMKMFKRATELQQLEAIRKAASG